MKISILINREPFGKIFEKTLTSFLSSYYNVSYKVVWDNLTETNNRSNFQHWYCNSLINSVFVKEYNNKIFDSIISEYKYNPNKPWLSFFQKLYIKLSTFRYTLSIASSKIVYISPEIIDAKNKLIIGGNTKIRLIDIANKCVFVMLKNGFDKKYIKNEIYIRENFSYLPLTKIFKLNFENLWYCEEYILGVPSNRINRLDCEKLTYKAINNIRRMIEDTKEKTSIKDYKSKLNDDLNTIINNTTNISSNIKKKINQIFLEFASYLSDQNIFVANCHGDFHYGNILSAPNKYWIIDWENTGIRQIAYDLFILLYGSRIEKGYSRKITDILNNKLDDYELNLVNHWPEIIENNKIKLDYLILFLIEDMIFYLDEYNNSQFYNKPKVFAKRIFEYEIILNHLNKLHEL